MQCHNSFLANSHNRCFDAICILYMSTALFGCWLCAVRLWGKTKTVYASTYSLTMFNALILFHIITWCNCVTFDLTSVSFVFVCMLCEWYSLESRMECELLTCGLQTVYHFAVFCEASSKYLNYVWQNICFHTKLNIVCNRKHAYIALNVSYCEALVPIMHRHTDMFEYSQYWVNIFEGYCIVSIKPSQRWKLDPFQPLALRQNKYYSYSLIRGERLSQKLPHWWTVNEWQSSGRPCSTDIKRSRWIILE